MIMKILFVYPSTGYHVRALSIPLGLLSIATYLKQHGHVVKIYDRCVSKEKISKVEQSFNPDIIGISLMASRGLDDAVQVSKFFKEKGAIIVWGGQLPSMHTDFLLRNCPVDLISIGEGEETWLELAQTLNAGGDYKRIRGLAYLEDGKTVTTEPRPFIDLASLPPSDWSLLDTKHYLQTYLGCKKMIYIYSSKGCPYHCAFCSTSVFHKSRYRKRPAETVIAEIKYLIEHHKMDGVYFTDEVWCLKRSDVVHFCNLIKEEHLHFYWGVQLVVGMFDMELYQLMYDCGCRWAFFGVESGSKKILDKMNKQIDYDRIVPTIHMLNEIGYTTIASFIIGYPGETREDLQQTVKLIQDAQASLTTVHHFTPLVGTKVYNDLVAEGKYESPSSISEYSAIVETESIGKNLSDVPDVDLKVIRAWYNWKGFTNKNAIRYGKSFEFAWDTFKSGLHAITRNGVFSFFKNSFSAAGQFSYVWFYSHAFPKIKKIYKLK